MPPRSPRATTADIAHASGVSRATVSYVLNDTPGQTIPASTRRRVVEAAAALGYVANRSARALARGRTDVVVIDMSALPSGELSHSLATAISGAFAARGYLPLVHQLPGNARHRAALVDLCAHVAPAVVVSVETLPDDIQERLRTSGVQHISGLDGPDGRGLERLIAPTCEAQVAHLASKGHRRIAYAPAFRAAPGELDGIHGLALHRAATERGLVVEDLPRADEPGDLADALSAMRARGITAVAAYNDDGALAVLAGAQRAGIRVPEQLAVIGADDVPLAHLSHPRLTSVRQTSRDPADFADFVDLVLRDAQVAPGPSPWLTIVEREST